MKKIILLGDSIRLIGYGKKVPAMLGDGYEVWQPTDNCRFAHYTLRGLWDWQKELEGADIIHWNNGLWDACELFDDGPFTPMDDYVKEMVRIAGILQKKAKKVIFATTTPVKPANPHDSTERIAKFNAALVPELEKMGVAINDLFTLVAADIEQYIAADNLHLSEAGIDLCADAVVKAIKKAEAEL
ncbi:MAG: SGNH/GDSL hydrolase family protein [Ruminococcaceae bacterium]|nr:SGNH/GDSL hydrolase family protein [Oscillospiraceae bacterium]